MVYVVFQFGILALLAIQVRISAVNLYSILLLALAGFVGLWAIYTMGRGNVRIRPELMEGAILRSHGPYKYIRHPMYASVLLSAIAMGISPFNWINLALIAGLIVTLLLKLRFEEKQLLARFPEYADYKKQTRYFIPFIL